MPCELGSARRLGFACVSLLLCACGTADHSSLAATADASVAPTTQPSGAAASMTPMADPSVAGLHVSGTDGWSIVAPPGWEVVAQNDSGTALSRDDAIAEVLVAASSGLAPEALQAQKHDQFSTWPGVVGIESDFVSLPAGDALSVRVTSELETGPQVFYLYVIEEGETQYVISVRGPQKDHQILADAEALAESFAITD